MNRDGSDVVQMFEHQMRSLTFGLGSTFLLDELPNDPSHVLIAAWDTNGTGAWLADVNTGRVERVADGSDQTWYYATDINGAPVMRVDQIEDGSGYRIYRRAPGVREWTFVLQARRAETATNSPDFDVIASGPGPGQVYVLARPENSDLASLYLYNAATGDLGQPLQQNGNADAASPWLSRRTREILATCEFAQRLDCQARDPAMQRHLNAIDSFFDRNATITLVNMSDDASKWLLHVDGPAHSGAYYLYEVAERRVSPVAPLYPNLDTEALSPTEIVAYSARDGTQLWAYVTARPGEGVRPMVVLPHGGPEARDYFGYNSFAQFLASRGYVVVQPNFRGGLGFGRAFSDLGRGQWGLRMQDDVTDVVRHMIATGAADPQRICIVGASYGGYAALQGVAATPELYRCAISIAGDSDLREVLREEARNGRSSTNYQYWLRSIGDPNTNRDALEANSPRRHAEGIAAPVLLIHGETDEVVPIRQSELMQQALAAAGRQTRLVRIPDEGHRWDDWSSEHRLTLYRETESFLAQHLGSAR